MLRILIDLSRCLLLLWLVGVITYVLVFRLSFENRPINNALFYLAPERPSTTVQPTLNTGSTLMSRVVRESTDASWRSQSKAPYTTAKPTLVTHRTTPRKMTTGKLTLPEEGIKKHGDCEQFTDKINTFNVPWALRDYIIRFIYCISFSW